MKRIFIFAFALIAACVANVQAQSPEYVQAVKTLMQSGGFSAADNYKSDDMKQAFMQILTADGMTMKEANKKVDAYFESQLVDDLAEVMTPYFEPYIPLSALQECLASLDEPAFKSVYVKMNAASQAVSQQTTQMMTTAIQAFTQGQTLEPLALDEHVSDSYLKQIRKMNKVLNTEATLRGMIEPIKAMLAGAMGDKMNAEQEKEINSMFDTLITYLADNSDIFTANAYAVSGISEAEVKQYTEAMKTEAWQQYVAGSSKATTGIVRDAMNVGYGFINAFQTWAKTH